MITSRSHIQHSVLVIGGSRGIGRELAIALNDSGICVASLARSVDHDDLGRTQILGDVTLEGGLDGAVAWLRGACAPRMVVVCAAVLGPVGPIDKIRLSDFEEAVNVNLFGAARIMSRLCPLLSRLDRMVFFLGGGIGGPSPQPRVLAYVASKGGLAHLIEAVGRDDAIECPVIGLSPGQYPTDFLSPVFQVSPEVAGNELLTQASKSKSTEVSVGSLVDVLSLLAGPLGVKLSGRIVSAQRDDFVGMSGHLQFSRDDFRLRRVDGHTIISASDW